MLLSSLKVKKSKEQTHLLYSKHLIIALSKDNWLKQPQRKVSVDLSETGLMPLSALRGKSPIALKYFSGFGAIISGKEIKDCRSI